MKRRALPALWLLILVWLALPSLAQETNLSDGRTLGIGMEVEYPWGGLVGVRYWLSPAWALEEVAFASGDLQGLSGTLTTRLLCRVADTAGTDFYVAAGATARFSPYGGEPATLSVVGGVEFAFSRAFAWNVEFGASVTTTGSVDMAIGTGIHYYF